jgi:hypothetical protein
MKHPVKIVWIGVVALVLSTILVACPPVPPTPMGAQWDSSNWDSTATWQ